VWRRALQTETDAKAQVTFELGADLLDQPPGGAIVVDGCRWLGAVKLP
jgi:hypothetical protein